MLLNDCRLCEPHILQLRIQRNTSDGDCGTAASSFEETWKSAEMPEVRDEEIDISYQKTRYPESRICWLCCDFWCSSRLAYGWFMSLWKEAVFTKSQERVTRLFPFLSGLTSWWLRVTSGHSVDSAGFGVRRSWFKSRVPCLAGPWPQANCLISVTQLPLLWNGVNYRTKKGCH